MSQTIMIACDLHDESMLLRSAVDRGRPVQRSFRNSAKGRQAMIAHYRAQVEAEGIERVEFVYEASSQGFTLYDEVTAAGWAGHVVAPTRMDRSPKSQRTKTDAHDAQRLLELLRAHVLAGTPMPDVSVPEPQLRDDREVVRLRLDLAEKATAVKAQVQGLLKRTAVRAPEGLGTRWAKKYRAWLGALASPRSPLAAGARTVLCSLLRQLLHLEEELERMDEEIRRLSAAPRYAEAMMRLSGRKGLGGVLTGMVYLTEMGRLDRFSNRRQVGAYLGLAPSSYESGATADRKGHITHQGPARVRKVLCQAVWRLVRYDPEVRAAHERIMGEQPSRRKIATVALMRQLAVQWWHAARGEARRRSPLVAGLPQADGPEKQRRLSRSGPPAGKGRGPAEVEPRPPDGHRPRRSGRTPAEPCLPGRRATG